MISLILLNKIVQLFLVMLAAFILVKAGVLKAEDSKVLSLLLAWVICPCVIANAFQLDCTPEKFHDMLVIILIFALTYGTGFIVIKLLKVPLRLNNIEQASIMYSNCGNLVIPLVNAILGEDWTLYIMTYNVLATILLWSHARMLVSGETAFSVGKIVKNINIIVSVGAFLMFAAGIHFPQIIQDTLSMVSGMIGPVSMLIVGMLIGGADIKKIFSSMGIWKTLAMRLIGFPLLMMVIIRLLNIRSLSANANGLIIIGLLCASAPSGTTLVQQTQIYGKDRAKAEYAGAINMASTMLCMITMPIMLAVYQLFFA